MSWKRFKWEIGFALEQFALASKHTGGLIVSLVTFNTRGFEARCEAEVDALVAKGEAERP